MAARVPAAYINAVAKKYGIPPSLFRRLINQESGGRIKVSSPAGAIGPAQLMPGTARGLGVNPYDWRQNLEGGARYLAAKYSKYKRWDLALAAYNAGEGAVDKYHGIPPYSETQRYVRNILGGKSYTSLATGTVGVRTQGSTQDKQVQPVGHPYSRFAQGLIAAIHEGSPEAMLGAIMQLRSSLETPPQPKQQGPSYTFLSGGQPQKGSLGAAERLAKQMGLLITSTTGGKHVKGSYHYSGRAADVSGTPSAMAAYYRRLAKTRPTELFYDPLGGIKRGKQIGAIGGHRTHVHIAY